MLEVRDHFLHHIDVKEDEIEFFMFKIQDGTRLALTGYTLLDAPSPRGGAYCDITTQNGHILLLTSLCHAIVLLANRGGVRRGGESRFLVGTYALESISLIVIRSIVWFVLVVTRTKAIDCLIDHHLQDHGQAWPREQCSCPRSRDPTGSRSMT